MSECLPLRNLVDLYAWKPPVNQNRTALSARSPRLPGNELVFDDLWNSIVTALNNEASQPKEGCPKTLLCHDMRGGYLEDRFVDGCHDVDHAPYRFTHWAGIDVFVYFSHHFVTIPPPGWIQAAHKHGVQILGTIITEWETGSRLCAEILINEQGIRSFVDKCVEVALACGFDGWLINIENPMEPEQVPKLISLCRLLTQQMREARGSESLVLWYDSVISPDGKLDWQNELNAKNKEFFDACDGIFLNYTWKVDDDADNLRNSIQALDDPGRRSDIFVGVDVFGRGCLGGGGFQCDVALEEIRKRKLSAAIFGPGWTHELPFRNVSSTGPTALDRDFVDREHKFWSSLAPFLSFRGPRIKGPHQAFATRFCQGCEKRNFASPREGGTNTSLQPEQDSPDLKVPSAPKSSWWFDLRRQEYQPSFKIHHGETSKFCMTNGSIGGGLTIETKAEDTIVPLFVCDINPSTDLVKGDSGRRIVFCVGARKQEEVINKKVSVPPPKDLQLVLAIQEKKQQRHQTLKLAPIKDKKRLKLDYGREEMEKLEEEVFALENLEAIVAIKGIGLHFSEKSSVQITSFEVQIM